MFASRSIGSAIVIMSWVALATPAFAATSGTVSGTLTFFQNQGGACPDFAGTANCTGWQYTNSEFQTVQPIAHVKFVIFDDLGNQIGASYTNNAGYYSTSWTSAAGRTAGWLEWYGEYSDNTFYLRNSDGTNKVRMWTPTKALKPGKVSHWYTDQWGQAGSAEPVSNVYDGARRGWENSFSYSGTLVTNFTNVEIRVFGGAPPMQTCPTSCAVDSVGPPYVIYIDSNMLVTPFEPTARVAHEMGHIASAATSQGGFRHVCAGGTSRLWDGVDGWSWNSPEYTCFSWEESFANFTAQVSRVWYNAVNPTTCADGDLASCTIPLETSSYPNCQTNEGREEVSMERFLWDAYDASSSGDYGGLDTISDPYGWLLDNNGNFVVGTGLYQRDRPWNGTTQSATLVQSQQDGRSAYAYNYNYQNWAGHGLSYQYSLNCSPPAD